MCKVALKIMAWCHKLPPASVGHPDTPPYRRRLQFFPRRPKATSSGSRRDWTKNHFIYLVFLILFQRKDPSHIIALHYPKSIQFVGISHPVHSKIIQPGVPRSRRTTETGPQYGAERIIYPRSRYIGVHDVWRHGSEVEAEDGPPRAQII